MAYGRGRYGKGRFGRSVRLGKFDSVALSESELVPSRRRLLKSDVEALSFAEVEWVRVRPLVHKTALSRAAVVMNGERLRPYTFAPVEVFSFMDLSSERVVFMAPRIAHAVSFMVWDGRGIYVESVGGSSGWQPVEGDADIWSPVTEGASGWQPIEGDADTWLPVTEGASEWVEAPDNSDA